MVANQIDITRIRSVILIILIISGAIVHQTVETNRKVYFESINSSKILTLSLLSLYLKKTRGTFKLLTGNVCRSVYHTQARFSWRDINLFPNDILDRDVISPFDTAYYYYVTEIWHAATFPNDSMSDISCRHSCNHVIRRSFVRSFVSFWRKRTHCSHLFTGVTCLYNLKHTHSCVFFGMSKPRSERQGRERKKWNENDWERVKKRRKGLRGARSRREGEGGCSLVQMWKKVTAWKK